jgi:molecular chaperone DnaK
MVSVPLSRVEFESLTRDLLTRTRLTTQQLLREAATEWTGVDRLLMVGGSSHMPMTGRMLEELSGKAPDRSLAVSEVVAHGAAIHAGIVAARGQEEGLELEDQARDLLGQVIEINVNSHGLGIEIKRDQERINDILIPKNTQLPAAGSRVYRTIAANQERVRVRVLQGDAHQAEACISIGECWIDDLPADLPRHAPIQVRCGCASNGLVEVMALDMTSGAMARAQIHRTSGLSEENIAKESAWVKGLNIQ